MLRTHSSIWLEFGETRTRDALGSLIPRKRVIPQAIYAWVQMSLEESDGTYSVCGVASGARRRAPPSRYLYES